MNYHITVEGIPHCQAPIYFWMQKRGLTAKQMCNAACSCGYGECKEDADRDATKLQQALPDLAVCVKEGKCHEDEWWQTPDGRAAIEMEDSRWD